MFSTFFTAALFATLAVQGAVAEFSVNSPKLTQCQNAQISYERTKGPYNIYVVDPKNPCGDDIAEVGQFDGTSVSWKVALPAGMNVQLYIEDADGDDAWSGPITVGASDDVSCLPAEFAKDVKESASSSPVAPSSSASPVVAGTTLVAGAPLTNPTGNPKTDSDPVPSAVGAANAGTNPFSSNNGAFTVRQVGTPFMAISAFVAAIVLAL